MTHVAVAGGPGGGFALGYARPRAEPLPTSRPSGWARAAHTDPRVLTGEVLLAFTLLLGFREQVTHAIGTASDAPVAAPAPVRPLFVMPPGTDVPLPRPAGYAAVVPVHEKRDPFAPLVGAHHTRVVPPAAPTPTVTPTAPAEPTATPRLTRRYVVRPGDSLWSIARAGLTGSPSTHRVTVAWHAIYTANEAAIGSDPSQLEVGTVLHLPQG